MTTADNGDLRLAAVVLYDFGNDAYIDTRAMFDYVYNNFSKVMLADQETPEEIDSYSENDSYVLLPAGIEFSDLEKEIEITDEQSREGTVTYTYQGQNVGSADVVLTKEYVTEKTGHDYTMQVKKGAAASDVKAGALTLALKIVIGIGAAFVVLVILLAVYIWQVRRRRMLRRRRRQLRRRREMRQNAAKRSVYREKR